MGQLVVSNLEDELVGALERRAVRNGRSTEEETREILRDALQREAPAEVAQLHDAIDALYEDLARLVARRRPGHDDLDLEQQVREALHQLRALQETSAHAMRERFDRRMSMPIHAGRQTLDEIKDFLERVRDEDRTP